MVDASGRVLRDNVWGPQIEDAARRDFTVNAMYYDPVQRELVVDYHGGLADAKRPLLRMIGDPRDALPRGTRCASSASCAFAAKLGFIEPAQQKPMREMKALLANVPASRCSTRRSLPQTGRTLRSVGELRRQGLDRGSSGARRGVPRRAHRTTAATPS